MKIIKKTYQIIAFILYYLSKLVQSNIYIAYDILTPEMKTKPGLIWIPIKTKSNLGILLFSNLLSMTPGSLSIDISDDKKELLVHFLYNNDKNKIINDIEKIQSRIIELTG